jgi:hypothetical protein
MAKSSRTHLEKCVNIILEQLQTTQGEALSMGFVSSSKRTDTFVEMVLQHNGYEVFSFDCNYYTKGNVKPQLMSFFTQVREQIRNQTECLKNPVILFRNTSLITYHEEDKELMISALCNGLNLDDDGFFYPDEHSSSSTAESPSVKTFIPLFSVTRNELPGEEHYRKIIYPNGDKVNNNEHVKKIWELREGIKAPMSSISSGTEPTIKKDHDNKATQVKHLMMPFIHGNPIHFDNIIQVHHSKSHGKILHNLVGGFHLDSVEQKYTVPKEKPVSHKHMMNIVKDININSKILDINFTPGGFNDSDSDSNSNENDSTISTKAPDIQEDSSAYIDSLTSQYISKATQIKELHLDSLSKLEDVSSAFKDTLAAIDALKLEKKKTKKNKYK